MLIWCLVPHNATRVLYNVGYSLVLLNAIKTKLNSLIDWRYHIMSRVAILLFIYGDYQFVFKIDCGLLFNYISSIR